LKYILRNEKILANAIDYLHSIKLDEDKPVQMVVKDFKKVRTEEQNALYWSWLRIIAKDQGNSTKAIHAYYGDKFLPKEIETVLGKRTETIKSTTELGVKEFTHYLQEVEADAATEFGIMLPHPGDLEW
jgi:hypothetical protein